MAIPDFKLSKYFSFQEMVGTSHYELVLQNMESAVPFVCPMTHFLTEIIDPLRALLGPMLVSSGFRCVGLNALVGGSPSSQHMQGTAIDLWRPEWDWQTISAEIGPKMARALRAGGLCGKIIMEQKPTRAWLHVSRGTELTLWTGINGKYTKGEI